jgi:hypothetical protein
MTTTAKALIAWIREAAARKMLPKLPTQQEMFGNHTQHPNPEAQARRHLKRKLGARQYRRDTRHSYALRTNQ